MMLPTASEQLEGGAWRYTFRDTAERNEWLNAYFPRRKASDAPGVFTVEPGGFGIPGGWLAVFCETVTVYPKED